MEPNEAVQPIDESATCFRLWMTFVFYDTSNGNPQHFPLIEIIR